KADGESPERQLGLLRAAALRRASEVAPPSQSPAMARARMKPSTPVAGSVKIQAKMIRSTTVHFTPLNRLAAPTPMIQVEITCVVESGIPYTLAVSIMRAALVSAANP